MISTDLLSPPTRSSRDILRSLGETHEALSPTRLKLTAQDLLTSLLNVRSRTRAAKAPRAIIRISVYRPDGRPAVAIMMGSEKTRG